jgi:hypothetical protein
MDGEQKEESILWTRAKKRKSPPNTFTTLTPVFQVETVAVHRISFLQFPQSFGNGRIGRNGYAKPKPAFRQ